MQLWPGNFTTLFLFLLQVTHFIGMKKSLLERETTDVFISIPPKYDSSRDLWKINVVLANMHLRKLMGTGMSHQILKNLCIEHFEIVAHLETEN